MTHSLCLTLTHKGTLSCVDHQLITHIFIFIESCCYRKGFWSKGWNGLFRLLKKTKRTSKVSLLTQKSYPWYFTCVGKMKSNIFTEMGSEGEKCFCLNQADKGFSLMKKENGCSFVCDILWKASRALSYYNSPQASLNFLAHCRGMQPLVHDMNN